MSERDDNYRPEWIVPLFAIWLVLCASAGCAIAAWWVGR